MDDSPFISGPMQVAIATTWENADGAMLGDDGEVVPMMDLGTATSFKLTVDHPDEPRLG